MYFCEILLIILFIFIYEYMRFMSSIKNTGGFHGLFLTVFLAEC